MFADTGQFIVERRANGVTIHAGRRVRDDTKNENRSTMRWPQTADAASSRPTCAYCLLSSQRWDLGVAFGLVVRSMGFTKTMSAGLRAMRQGEVTEYTQLLEDSRRHAIDRMIENARLLGANAVIAMRFDSSEIGQTLTEIVAYGTAVIVRPTA
jgi:uncharacterized protein YbjQ (UPF0145 family)